MEQETTQQPSKPRYTCAECGLGVIIIGDKIIRGCTHEESAIHAACSATVYGESKIEN